MQGYILNINRVKDEDLIVAILTKSRLVTLYRFYGARHSHINIGYKIDFEIVSSAKSTISNLRSVLPLPYSWMLERNRFFIWQEFIKLLYKHLRDVEEIGGFYYEMLDKISRKMQKQNPKRVVIEAYLELLEYEGRLHREFVCFVCEESVEGEMILARGFLPSHRKCAFGKSLDRGKVEAMFEKKSTIELSDSECEAVYEVLCEGL
jgi:hypothetical protein